MAIESPPADAPARQDGARSAAPPAAPLGSALRAAFSLAWREWLRFIRQPNRVVGALGQPALFWLLFGAGLGPSFAWNDESGRSIPYREYFFPGSLVLILLFTAIFSTISIIEDRREGFLQSVLVAPIPRWSMVLGKLLGGTLLAVAQSLLFLPVGWAIGLSLSPLSLLPLCCFLFVTALGLVALGFVMAWRMESTQGFHAVMNLFLMPMWLLSGSFFPIQGGVLGWLAAVNPVTYAVAGLRRMLYTGDSTGLPAGLPGLFASWLVVTGFALLLFGLSCRVARSRTTGDLM
jgi:ABC-2 type transport system permease protein